MTQFEIEILAWERLTKWLREAKEIRELCESRSIQVPHLLMRFFDMINQSPGPGNPP